MEIEERRILRARSSIEMCEMWTDEEDSHEKRIINHLLKSDFYWKFEYQIRVDFVLCLFNFTSIKRYCKETRIISFYLNIKLLCLMAIWANKIVYRQYEKRHRYNDFQIRRVDLLEFDLLLFFLLLMGWIVCWLMFFMRWLFLLEIIRSITPSDNVAILLKLF